MDALLHLPYLHCQKLFLRDRYPFMHLSPCFFVCTTNNEIPIIRFNILVFLFSRVDFQLH